MMGNWKYKNMSDQNHLHELPGFPGRIQPATAEADQGDVNSLPFLNG